MASPVLSVIMPVYNAQRYVFEAIESILKQTFTDFEFLIYNDASTDTSREIILSFQDPRIRLIDSPTNTGYVKHLNHGLQQAKGEYIARMDADDIAHPDRFMLQLHYLNQHPKTAVCGSWIEFMGSKNGILEYPVNHHDIVTHLFLFGNALAHPAVMMRKSVFTDHQVSYDETLEPAEDYDLWNRISTLAQLHNIPLALLKYRVHDQNESVVKKAKQDFAVSVIRERLFKMVLDKPSAKMHSFLLHQFPEGDVTDQDLCDIRLDVFLILNTGRYDELTLKTVLSNRFVAWCKISKLSGFDKMMHYIRFTKHLFSVRICLSLLLNK